MAEGGTCEKVPTRVRCRQRGDVRAWGMHTNWVGGSAHTHTHACKEDAGTNKIQVPEGCMHALAHTYTHTGKCSHSVQLHIRRMHLPAGGRECSC